MFWHITEKKILNHYHENHAHTYIHNIGQPVNASLPSPTMPTFNMAAAQPNGQPAGAEAVYSNGIPHTYPGRKKLFIIIY